MPETPATPLTSRPRKLVFNATGSYGDVHPYLGIALGMQARGHDAVFATSECYRAKVEKLGLTFYSTRPNADWVTDPRIMQRIMDQRMGTVRAVRERVLPYLRETYDDLVSVTRNADLLVSHMPWGARLVAEKTGIPWVSTMVTPMGFFSAHDVPVFPLFPQVSKTLRHLGPGFWTVVFRSGSWATRAWARPFYRARKELGLPPCRDWNPLGDSHSPHRVLALFSPLLAAPQPDWPANTVQTGFPFFDQGSTSDLPADLERFLDAGPPPIVFTLADSAAAVADRFFEHSIAATQRLGRRAVLITGRIAANQLKSLPENIASFEYAPFSKLFPRAAAIVHPGGVGTTGLGMRSGRPTLVVPFAHDQPDNAARVTRLGIARTISRFSYKPERVESELNQLLENPLYTQKATQIASQLQQENGVVAACDALENFLVNH